jgi:GNAT superfamily N-acetyltransferase
MTIIPNETCLRVGSARLLARRAGAEDRAALEAMFQRCSPTTIYQRFHGVVRAWPRAYLDEALSGSDMHYAVVCYSGREAIAQASYRVAEADSAELGILVEDAWQRRGLGGQLLGVIVAHAVASGIRVLRAQVLTEQDWIIGVLARHGPCTSAFGRGVREVAVTLAPSTAGAAAEAEAAEAEAQGAEAQGAEAPVAGALSLGGRGTG